MNRPFWRIYRLRVFKGNFFFSPSFSFAWDTYQPTFTVFTFSKYFSGKNFHSANARAEKIFAVLKIYFLFISPTKTAQRLYRSELKLKTQHQQFNLLKIMPYTNLSASLSPGDKQAILQNLQAIQKLLPFAVNLTREERRALAKVGDKRYAFIVKTMEYTITAPQFNPVFMSLPEADKDVALYNDLRSLLSEAVRVVEMMDDTQMAAGVESFDYCREYYNVVLRAKEQNVQGAESIFEDLRELFERSSEDDAEPPPSQP